MYLESALLLLQGLGLLLQCPRLCRQLLLLHLELLHGLLVLLRSLCNLLKLHALCFFRLYALLQLLHL